MRYHRTVGPPSKPGHGRGSAPYGRSDSTSRPWGGASWTVEKQRASCKSLSRLLALSGTWRDALWNISFELGLTLVALSLEHLWSCAHNFASTPTKPTIYSKAKDRRHNIKVQRAERLRTKGKLSVTSRGSIHISRVFHTRTPGDARTNPRGFRGQRPEQRI